ncbi:LysR family transcriptional regulator [Nocardiopsis metallicus]|uniref:DNA-binding transcriptional LysR family regulator n=1 Tax=Nocardiopsis metallicus TaxID=179819 RepID=A0A840W5Z4_9ACTN|nr:DNA-binding transcriptional LysR family regulator [Nocardiopsis metallicus]
MTYRISNGSVSLDAEPGPDGPLDLQLLRTFLAVHRSGSFTAAAQLLRLSQPTVTTQIRALERRLGYALFERLPRGVAPTSDANDLAARVAGPLDDLETVAFQGGPGRSSAPTAPLRLAGPAELLSERALPALAPLVAEEGLRLRVHTGLADDLLEGLRAGRHDLVLSSIRPRGRAVLAEPLMDEEFVLVAAPVWAEKVGLPRVRRQGCAALCGVPLVTYADDLPIARRYWRHVFGVRLTHTPELTVPDLRSVMAAVVNGAGATVLPRYLCQRALLEGDLVALLEPEDPPFNTVYLVRRPGATDNPHLDLVRSHLTRAARTW